MPQGLEDEPSGLARAEEIARGCPTKIECQLLQLDLSRHAIGQDHDFGGYLIGEVQQVGGVGAGHLPDRSAVAHDAPDQLHRVWGGLPEDRMRPGAVVEAAANTTEIAALRQTLQCLANGCRAADVREVPGGKGLGTFCRPDGPNNRGVSRMCAFVGFHDVTKTVQFL